MYAGQTYNIPQTGGWSCNPNQDEVPIESMVDPININHNKRGRQPRGGCERFYNTEITDNPGVKGIFQFLRENGNIIGYYLVDEGADNIGDENGNILVSEGAFLMTGCDNGTIQYNAINELKTGLNENSDFFFEVFYDTLVASTGNDIPQVWDGVQTYTWDLGSPWKLTAALGTGAGNVDNGTHSYKVTFVSAAGESTPSLTSAIITVVDKAVNGKGALSAIPTGPEGTTSRILYRTVAGDTGDYLLLDTIADNTTTTYSDNIADGSLGAAAPTTSRAFWPSDWDNDYPKWFVAHGRGISRRLWAGGCKGHPNRLYASKNSVLDFSDDNVETMDILCPSIVGLREIGGNLIAFGNNRRVYFIDDTNLSVLNWGYYKAGWDGSAAHQKLIAVTPTDAVAMGEDGEVFSISAAQQIGDNQIASISRPAHINEWIDENVDLEQIENFHMNYDPELRCIKIFVVLKGYTWPTAALVYFIDLGPLHGWTKHEFKIKHLCSAQVRISWSIWKLYTGNKNGLVIQLESEELNDLGSFYETSWSLPKLAMGNPRSDKRYDRVTIVNKYLEESEEMPERGYIFNGYSGSVTYQDTDEYDPDIWTSKTDTPLPSRYGASAANINSKGYIFNGDYGGSTIQDTDEYDPDTWTSKTDTPLPARCGASAATINSKGYIFNGYSSIGSALQDTDEYDP
ncbi:MAG: hypothetical protein OEL89_04905, partial [Candidatus Peregrinibacteria bacterium]|nr:hypothetical protein [Candidatus Peregrinibacteria bacterium]